MQLKLIVASAEVNIVKYIIDNDLHIHSQLSSCSSDPEQTPGRILQYAEENGLKTICLTDHFWDELVPGASEWYAPQNFTHICQAKPLPQSDKVRFLFGCETDLDRHLTPGISSERMAQMDFIIIPTTHMHMRGFTLTEEDGADIASRAKAWVKRLDAVLNMDLPFHKVGIAHLTCRLVASPNDGYSLEDYLKLLRLLPEEEMYRLFQKAAQVGVGIELNASDMGFADENAQTVLRPYRIAKKCGCKFYLGSDAHHPAKLETTMERFEKAVELLNLQEEDKFILA